MIIWINIRERTGKFLGAYTSKERAFDASAHSISDNDSVVTMSYKITEPLPDKQITLEDILNAKEE